MKKGYTVIICILLLSVFSCDSYKKAKDFALSFVNKEEGQEGQKKETEKGEVDKTVVAEKEIQKPTPDTVSPPSPEELQIQHKFSPPTSASSPPPVVRDSSIPLKPLDHFGGEITSLDLGDQYLYIGFGRKLVLFDNQLKSYGFVNLESASQKVIPIKTKDSHLLYVQEARNILEIIQVSTIGSPKILKSFEVEGPFSVALISEQQETEDGPKNIYSHQLFVFLKDRVQILDVTRPEKIDILFELPIPHVSQVFQLDNFLYIVSGSDLKVVEADTMAILSSVSLGAPFKILGARREEDTAHLIVALRSSQGDLWQTLQFIPLIANGGGVDGLGQGKELKKGANDVYLDRDQPFIYLMREGELGLFDMNRQSELNGPKALLGTPLKFVGGSGGLIFVASERSFGRFEYQILDVADGNRTEKNKEAVDSDTNTMTVPDIPALADLPDSEMSKKNYEWTNQKLVPVAADVYGVLLTAKDSVLVLNTQLPDEPIGAPLFYSLTSTTNTQELLPLRFPNKGIHHLSLNLVVDYGLLVFNQEDGKIYLIKKDFSSIEPVSIATQSIVGLDSVREGENDYLYIAASPPAGKGEIGLVSYKVDSAKQLKKVTNLSFSEIGGIKVFQKGTRALVACGQEGLCLVEIGQGQSKITRLTNLPPSKNGARALEVALSPDNKIAYVYYTMEGGAFISLVSFASDKMKEHSMIENISMSASQFRGLTFSQGGQLLILPQDSGLTFYNVKNPSQPTLNFTWSLGKAYSADVANRGKTVCVALGRNGVECGVLE